MSNFDPNNPGVPGKIFGLPYSLNEADIILLPVPWDVTTSYKSGTALGPGCILEASSQIDFAVPGIVEPWKLKVAMLEIDQQWQRKSATLRKEAVEYIKWFESGTQKNERRFLGIREKINQASEELNRWVYDQASGYLGQGKLIGAVGGEHSAPLGLINALSGHFHDFGILQIDAHMDLREAYEGFQFSHASIMFNALKNNPVTRLIQVGIRDYCEEEENYVDRSKGRVITYFDVPAKEAIYEGEKWSDLCDSIIADLPQNVYISFDIDGLDPGLCPNTGTPVPGGLAFTEARYLIKKLVESGRIIVGFDLSEVAPGSDQWDGNVGSRILYQLCVYAGISQGKLKYKE